MPRLEVEPGAAEKADLTIELAPGFRDLLAGELDPRIALADGSLRIAGDPALLDDFISTFHVAYSPVA